MPIEFKIVERLIGFLATSVREGENAIVVSRVLLGPQDPKLVHQLDELERALFSKIPGLPPRPLIADLILIINQDLTGLAYVNELPLPAKVKLTRDIEKGELVYLKDISEIKEVTLGVEVPSDAAIVVVRSFNWKKSMFFDFGPLDTKQGDRTYNVDHALGQQLALLMGLPAQPGHLTAGAARIAEMKSALDRLIDLIDQQCKDEVAYQQLLESAPWMLGTSYSAVLRHQRMDDANIPDFTALRAYDECHDVIELKQPFLRLFRKDGSFSAAFNDAWNQAERYLDFCQRQRTYLMDQKQLRFENPRCILVVGHELTVPESEAVRAKESANRMISVMTYDQLYRHARNTYDIVVAANDDTYLPSDIVG